MVDLIYTGRSTANHAEFLSLQKLLASLGICLDVGWSKDSSEENLCAGFSVTNGNKPGESPISVELDMILQKSCDVVPKSEVGLTKHLNSYDENFRQFIRHKVTKHRALQVVSTRKVRKLLDRDPDGVMRKLNEVVHMEVIGDIGVDKHETTGVMMDDVVRNVSETEGNIIQEEPSKSYLTFKSFASKCAKSENIVDTLSSTSVVDPNTGIPITLSNRSVVDSNTGIPIQVAGADGNKAAVNQIMVKYRTDQGVLWRCNVCGYQNKRKSDLFTHVESNHIDIALYNCPYCVKPFRTRYALRKHVKGQQNLFGVKTNFGSKHFCGS
eukprot:GFUD01118454.1.p1 GENE.GFUD01118454.1~~GFUD01118454.1.p1  ORF type:complete len:341 (-),score=71.02 GFUD01118454.1:82-1056(-)